MSSSRITELCAQSKIEEIIKKNNLSALKELIKEKKINCDSLNLIKNYSESRNHTSNSDRDYVTHFHGEICGTILWYALSQQAYEAAKLLIPIAENLSNGCVEKEESTEYEMGGRYEYQVEPSKKETHTSILYYIASLNKADLITEVFNCLCAKSLYEGENRNFIKRFLHAQTDLKNFDFQRFGFSLEEDLPDNFSSHTDFKNFLLSKSVDVSSYPVINEDKDKPGSTVFMNTKRKRSVSSDDTVIAINAYSIFVTKSIGAPEKNKKQCSNILNLSKQNSL